MQELELMRLHCDALYVQNDVLDIVCINDWLRRPAPVFWMGVTHGGIQWRFRDNVSSDIRVRAERMIDQEPHCVSAEQPRHHDAFRSLFGMRSAIAGPTYWLSDMSAYRDHPTQRVSAANAYVLQGSELDAWIPDIPHQQPVFASLVRGRAVAVCASVRSTGAAHEAGVETLPHHRRAGHATAAVAAWARELLGAGIVPLYSTSWSNLASQRVASALGFEAFGWEYRIG